MNTTILLIVGIIIISLGIASLFNPNFSRWLNLPVDPRLKAFISILVGTIVIIINFML